MYGSAIKRDESNNSLNSLGEVAVANNDDENETKKNKKQRGDKKQKKISARQDQFIRGNNDWMSTVGAGIEPSIYLNHHQAYKQSRLNEVKLRQTLNYFEQKKESQVTTDWLRKAESESRQAMMPQVRIRNVSKEYKLVAGVFSPELLKREENWGKKNPMEEYASAQ